MSESQLNREFSKRDVQRMRNIDTGNTANRTRVQAGYENESKESVFGENVVIGKNSVINSNCKI